MREILFHGKRIDNEEWIEGYYVHLYDAKGHESHRIYTGYAETDCGDFYPDWFEVDPETVGQWTGLYDNTEWEYLTEKEREDFTRAGNFPSEWEGKKIFEGDIVVSTNERRLSNKPKIVKYCPLSGYWMCDPKREPIVVGNRWDNPELLKGGE